MIVSIRCSHTIIKYAPIRSHNIIKYTPIYFDCSATGHHEYLLVCGQLCCKTLMISMHGCVRACVQFNDCWFKEAPHTHNRNLGPERLQLHYQSITLPTSLIVILHVRLHVCPGVFKARNRRTQAPF